MANPQPLDLTRPLAPANGILGGAMTNNVFTGAAPEETGEQAATTEAIPPDQAGGQPQQLLTGGLGEMNIAMPTGEAQAEAPGGQIIGLPNLLGGGLIGQPQPEGEPTPEERQGAYEVVSAVDQIQRITPETIEGTSYEPVEVAPAEQVEATGYEAQGYETQLAPEAEGYEATGYEAEGYEALQGVARTTAENVSQAIQRITGADSPIMQRAVAQATAEANRRGLLNTSMAAAAAQGAILDRAQQIAQADVQSEQFNVAQQNAMEAQNIQMGNEALQFSANARNQASAFLASAQNRAAEFIAAERNQNGRFNAEQSNNAAAFSANAANRAAEFSAAAQNQAAIFNAGEANRLSMFAAEQANVASRFAAEMDQAASQFNATAFNQAEQRYADAMNAAIMAQTDAENQSRRDLSVFTQQAEQNRLDRENRVELANISAGASMAAASASAAASMANAQAQREFAAGQAALDREFRSQENEASRQYSQQQLGVQAYNNFTSQVGQIMQNTNLTDEGRRNAINTLMSLHNGNPYAQVNINLGGGS